MRSFAAVTLTGLLAAIVLGAVAAPADAQDSDAKYGACSVENTWIERDYLGSIRVDGTMDGGLSNNIYVEIDTDRGGRALASDSASGFGFSAHSYAASDWVYVGRGTSVYVWSGSSAQFPYGPNGCNDDLASGFYTTG